MLMACKGRCATGRAADGTEFQSLPYMGGRLPSSVTDAEKPNWKTCRVCAATVCWAGVACPCCSQRLRLRGSRRSKLKNDANREKRHTRQLTDPAWQARPCRRCGAIIPAGTHPNHKYCSEPCSRAAHRTQRHRTDPRYLLCRTAAAQPLAVCQEVPNA